VRPVASNDDDLFDGGLVVCRGFRIGETVKKIIRGSPGFALESVDEVVEEFQILIRLIDLINETRSENNYAIDHGVR